MQRCVEEKGMQKKERQDDDDNNTKDVANQKTQTVPRTHTRTNKTTTKTYVAQFHSAGPA